jgi:hypothetical protein
MASEDSAVEDLVMATAEEVHLLMMAGEVTVADATKAIVRFLRGKVTPRGCERDCAKVLIDTNFGRRTSGGVELITRRPIGDLSALESELTHRAIMLGASMASVELTDEGDSISMESLLLLAALARMASLTTALLSLYESTMYPATGPLYRAIVELWLVARDLTVDRPAAVDALIAAHRWEWRGCEPTESNLRTLFGARYEAVTPRRMIISDVAKRVEAALGEDGAWVGTVYEVGYREASRLHVHASLEGLLSHLHVDDERAKISVQERDVDALERKMRVLIPVAALIEIMNAIVKIGVFADSNGKFTKAVASLKDTMKAVVEEGDPNTGAAEDETPPKTASPEANTVVRVAHSTPRPGQRKRRK